MAPRARTQNERKKAERDREALELRREAEKKEFDSLRLSGPRGSWQAAGQAYDWRPAT